MFNSSFSPNHYINDYVDSHTRNFMYCPRQLFHMPPAPCCPLVPALQSPFSQCLRTLVPTSVTALSDALVALNSECTTNSFLDAQMYTDLLYPGFPPGTTADVAQVTATAQVRRYK